MWNKIRSLKGISRQTNIQILKEDNISLENEKVTAEKIGLF